MPDSNEYLAKQAYVDAQLAQKQDKLIAGQNITIGADGKTISATGGGATYTAGTGISISQQNEIGLSAQTQATLAYLDQNKQDKLVAGDGISIEGNVISVTGGGGGGKKKAVKTYHATGTTGTWGYLAIDLNNDSIDPTSVFAVVTDENCAAACIGLTWYHSALTGVFTLRRNVSQGSANLSVSYTVFYYDKTIQNSGISSYLTSGTFDEKGIDSVNLQSGVDSNSVFAVVIDSSYVSTNGVMSLSLSRVWYNDNTPLCMCVVAGTNIDAAHKIHDTVPYRVFYYTSEDAGIKSTILPISTNNNGYAQIIPDSELDITKFFNVVVTEESATTAAGDHYYNKGLYLDNEGLKSYFGKYYPSPEYSLFNANFNARAFYIDDSSEPEPSKQEVITHTTAEWAQLTSLVSEEGVIYVWSDYKTEGGVTYPGMKIGDGLAYVVDLPFATEPITSAQITKWDNKVSVDINGENLIFLK